VVKPAVAILIVTAWGSAALAQPADWSRAGGSLFVGGASPSDLVSPDLSLARLRPPAQPFAAAVAAAAERHGLDSKLLHAVVAVESGYRADALSPAGAAGLTQLMPATAAELGVRDRFDPAENLEAGADFLARQVLRFGDLKLALAAGRSVRAARHCQASEGRP